MNWRTAIFGLAALLGSAGLGATAQAQVLVVGGAPVYASPVVVARPVVPAYVAPTYVAPGYVAPTYSVGYAGYSTYSPVVSAYSPVVPPTYVAPAPVVTYRPVVPVATYPAYRPGVVTSRAYYPGQPVRNALRVLAP